MGLLAKNENLNEDMLDIMMEYQDKYCPEVNSQYNVLLNRTFLNLIFILDRALNSTIKINLIPE